MAQDYDYGQLIDDFELDADVMPGESLTDYIERRRREFESKANGGSIGIEVLFGPKREEYQTGGVTVGGSTSLASLQRQGYKPPIDSRATAQDYANALRSVSAGTTGQQQADARRYARNQASQMLNEAAKANPQTRGIENLYNTFFKGKNVTGVSPVAFGRSGSGTNPEALMYYRQDEKDNILDAMANQMLNTTQYSQPKINERREKEFADYMNNLIASTYGKADDYRAEAMTLGMPTSAYFDYLVTSDPKDVMTSYDTLSRDPYFDPKTYVKTDYSNPETPRPPSPYGVYFQRELQRQVDAGIPEGQRIQQGQVMGLPTVLPGGAQGSQMGPGYESYADAVARTRQMMGLKDGGRVGMVSGGFLKGIGSFFKAGKDKIDDIIETKAMEKVGFRSKDDIPLSTYSEMKAPIKLSEMENIPEDQLKKILRTQELGLYKETPEILKAANLLERFTKKVGGKRVIDYERAEDILNVKLKGNETLDELFKIEFRTRPENRLADGGRVGLFMGGPALEGQALSVYESMNAYGFTDQEIANQLSSQGLYTPNKTTTTTPVINQAPNIINQGGDGGGGGNTITFSDPNFNLGPNKDVVDYEADAYGIGPTFRGQLARAYMSLKSLPTPFNIASKGIGNIKDFFEKRAIEKQKAEAAAAQVAFEQAMDQGRSFYDQFGKGDAASSATREQAGAGYSRSDDSFTRSPFAKGGLATMFKPRRR